MNTDNIPVPYSDLRYVRTTTASRRATARSQQRYSHISLWYEKQKEGEYKSIKDMAPKGQITRTSSKRLTAAERHAKLLRTKAGRWNNWGFGPTRTILSPAWRKMELENAPTDNGPDIERVNPFLPYLDPSDDGTQRSAPE